MERTKENYLGKPVFYLKGEFSHYDTSDFDKIMKGRDILIIWRNSDINGPFSKLYWNLKKHDEAYLNGINAHAKKMAKTPSSKKTLSLSAQSTIDEFIQNGIIVKRFPTSKAKVLISFYGQESGFTTHRIYFEQDFDQAQKDLDLVNENGLGKTWDLRDCEIYNPRP